MTSGKHGALLKVLFVRMKWKEYPHFFIHKDQQITGDKSIADKFNEYFAQIGPGLATSLDIANKAIFDTNLNKPNSSSFQFQYTDVPSMQKIINHLKQKSRADHDNISSKLLRQIGDIVAYPLSVIVNQSSCTGIFPHRIKLAKVIPLYKKDDNKLFGNYRPIFLLSFLSKVLKKSYLINYMIIWSLTVYVWLQKTTLDQVSCIGIDRSNPPRNGSRSNTLLCILRHIEGIRYTKSSYNVVKISILCN